MRLPIRPARRLPGGFTLVELMVSLVIGFVVIGALLAAYLAAFTSGRHNDAMTQIAEDATLALNVIRTQVAQAGYSPPTGTGVNGNGMVVHSFTWIVGCESSAFADLTSAIGATTCGAAGGTTTDALEVAYDATPVSGTSNGVLVGGAPVDCLGNTYAATSDSLGPYFLNDSKFYVQAGRLYCRGPGAAAGAPLVDNVEDLQIRYGIASAPWSGGWTPQVAQVKYYEDAPAIGSTDWGNVVSVSICVQVRSATRVLDPNAVGTLDSYYDCTNTRRTNADGYMRRTFSTTVVLQGKLA